MADQCAEVIGALRDVFQTGLKQLESEHGEHNEWLLSRFQSMHNEILRYVSPQFAPDCRS